MNVRVPLTKGRTARGITSAKYVRAGEAVSRQEEQLRFRHNATSWLPPLVIACLAARFYKAAPERRNAVARCLF